MTLVTIVVVVMAATAFVLLVSGRLRLKVSGEKGQAIALGLLVAALSASVVSNAFQIEQAGRITALERPTPQAVEVTVRGNLRECLENDAVGRACRRQLVSLLERGLAERQRQKRRERRQALRREAARLQNLLRPPGLSRTPRTAASSTGPVRRVARRRAVARVRRRSATPRVVARRVAPVQAAPTPRPASSPKAERRHRPVRRDAQRRGNNDRDNRPPGPPSPAPSPGPPGPQDDRPPGQPERENTGRGDIPPRPDEPGRPDDRDNDDSSDDRQDRDGGDGDNDRG